MKDDRFWAKVDKSGECWVWTGTRSKQGYGKCSFNNLPWLAHRLSWFLTFRGLPLGMCVLHKCDNPPCVNPSHLFIGTRLDNMADMKSKGRRNGNTGAVCGERQGMHKLETQDIRDIRNANSLGVSQRELSRKFGVSQTTIYAVVHQRSWKHV